VTEEVLLAGKYAMVRRLGRGGMAEVHLAKQLGVGGFEKLVVVKRPLVRFARDPHFRAMFLEEARMAADLRHPNIVSVLEVGDDEQGHPYLVMEYLHGKDMGRVARRCVRQGSALPLTHALQVVIDAAAGLDYAHKKIDFDGEPLCLVHRDISPQNLICTFHGQTVLVDFGIAKARGRSVDTEAGMLKGKCCYMSPEQVRGDEIDHRSDLFALGIVLYELCTMKPLFRRKSDLQSLQAVLACDVPRPSTVSPDLDPRLDSIIQTTLAPDPDDRYDDCQGLLNALEDYLDQRRILHSSRRVGRFVQRLFFDEADDASVVEGFPEEEDTSNTAITADIGVSHDGDTRRRDATKVVEPRPLGTQEDINGERVTAHGPPLMIDGAARTNLGPPRTPLIGREDELRELRRAFRSGARVVTLAGASGTGTSRIAAGYGYERLGDYSRHGGVWRVDCAGAESIDELMGAVARTLRFALPPELAADGRARHSGEMLGHRGRMLIILDGCDHVPAVDLVVTRWMESAHELAVLVAAHHALDVQGERVLKVLPLAVPAKDATDEQIERCPSVQVLEAHLARAGASGHDLAELGEIARRVDGVPLALEVAAGHVARSGMSVFLDELREVGTGMLEGLEFALETSWSILSPPERDALGQLSVLPGSFDVETAAAVIDVEGHEPLRLLDALARKSLVHRLEHAEIDGQVRLRMYGPLRALAGDRVAPELRLAAARRRAAYLLPRCVDLARGIDGPGGRRMLERLSIERDNLVAIAELALEGGQGTDALRASIALEAVLQGEPALHLSLLDRALAASERGREDRALLALGYEVRSDLHRAAGRFDDAQSDLDQALHLARDVDHRLEGVIYRNLAVLKRKRGLQEAALHDAKAALGIFKRMGDRHMEARARLELGTATLESGDAEAAREAFTDALRTFRLVGDRRFEARTLARLARARAALGEQPVARVLAESAAAILGDMGERIALGRTLAFLGDVNHSLASTEAAIHAWSRAARELGAGGAHRERMELVERAGRSLVDDAPDHARRFLDMALTAARALGDDAAAARIEREERAL
jgi:serine/threonine protein kinase/tetratricopeptide (TPR) repeat protein